ncbi:MAG: thioredoxin-disulfide reductase [Bacteroidota bacterium]|nr:thioredoxin-disulfide reductase [Bacteroidota bacterium]
MSSNHRKVIIIGSGPAGLTAAIYASRANLAPLIFEGIQPGGQLTITTEVENYPGFEHGIQGPELMDVMRKQAVRFGTESQFKIVSKVDFAQRPFKVWVDEELFTADSVIVSTGASAKWLDIPSEKEFSGYGVSACATCDGFFFRNQEVYVVGGGDTAMEEASFLTKFASKLTLIHRREEFRASKVMQDRVLNNPKVSVEWNSVVEEVLGIVENNKKKMTGLKLKNVKTGETKIVKADGLFLAIGHKPNTEIFAGILDMHENGYLKVQAGSTKTNIEGVFAAGDVADHYYRQAITAAGSGCMAAIDAERWLAEQG